MQQLIVFRKHSEALVKANIFINGNYRRTSINTQTFQLVSARSQLLNDAYFVLWVDKVVPVNHAAGHRESSRSQSASTPTGRKPRDTSGGTFRTDTLGAAFQHTDASFLCWCREMGTEREGDSRRRVVLSGYKVFIPRIFFSSELKPLKAAL